MNSNFNYSCRYMNKIKTKIQIFNESNSAFGPGKAELLLAISNNGSISSAAKSMNMSYKRAWDLVNEMNMGFKEDLVATKIGGSHGAAPLMQSGWRNQIARPTAENASHIPNWPILFQP